MKQTHQRQWGWLQLGPLEDTFAPWISRLKEVQLVKPCMTATSDHHTWTEGCLFCNHLWGPQQGLPFLWIDFTDILYPSRKISRRIRAKRPKPFIYRSTPNLLPSPYMNKYALFPLSVRTFQIVLEKCHPQTGSSGFLVLGEKGEGRGRE